MNVPAKGKNPIQAPPAEVSVTFIETRSAEATSGAHLRLAAQLDPALRFFQTNFRSKLRSADLAQEAGMSLLHFHRVFREAFGTSFRNYAEAYRLRQACRLLENPTPSVPEVAMAVGFDDVNRFRVCFLEQFGVSPAQIIGQPVLGMLDCS